MQTKLNPYLAFAGDAQQAMEFYRDVFGGELTINKFSDYPTEDGSPAPEGVMHAMLVSEGGMTLMASDMSQDEAKDRFGGVSISLSGDDEGELKSFFEGLSDGGTVTMPLAPQMWGDTFGMVTDKFGINWLVNIAKVTANA